MVAERFLVVAVSGCSVKARNGWLPRHLVVATRQEQATLGSCLEFPCRSHGLAVAAGYHSCLQPTDDFRMN